jgi:CheY-like chemotaxis protein
MDDAPSILGLFREILEEDGYRVTASQERLDLLQIRALQPDAILLELRHAGRQAPDVAFLITMREDPALAHIPIILSTTWTRLDQNAAISEQWRVRVLRKPFDIDDLLAVLREALTAARSEFAGEPLCAGSQ